MDRRAIWAIIAMMLIAVAPSFLFKKPPVPAGSPTTQPAGPAPVGPSGPAADAADSSAAAPAAGVAAAPAPEAEREDTVLVTSPLYRYGVSTRGARLVNATLAQYRSMAPADSGQPVQLMESGDGWLGLTLVSGGDTIPLRDWTFTPSAPELQVSGAPAPLTFSAERGPIRVEITYTFAPDNYRVDAVGRVTGLGPNGGLLLADLGRGIRNTEADSSENHRHAGLVTKDTEARRRDFSGLDAGRPEVISGPFEWVAIKSKYFVTGLFAYDSSGGRISGVTATAPATAGKKPTSAAVQLSLPLAPSGTFGYTVYAGPMEYERLSGFGHDFDDVNPYGWPGFRTLIRFFAVPVRWLLVWMHEHLYFSYGVVLIVFGILVRLVLWPLNQKAMRSSMAMQAIQPQLKALQERHANNPQMQQQEMFKLYKEHNVNPLGGCWPMLLPMPVMFALFFVFQNAIEFRGVSFLWLPDLSAKDPYFIIPLLMGVSMYFLSKVGQMGMEPNPQMKMMLYMMPVMMTGMFAFFPSGLNLYYTVSNIASIPQQWMLARERKRNAARAIVEVKTKPEKKAGGKR
jgi:YidC/Oxa1 family membrane protein insertase